MTLKDIENMPDNMLTVEDIAPYVKCDPHQLRIQAQNNPAKLGYPVSVHGTRVQIPREGFVFFMRYGHPMIVQAARTDEKYGES